MVDGPYHPLGLAIGLRMVGRARLLLGGHQLLQTLPYAGREPEITIADYFSGQPESSKCPASQEGLRDMSRHDRTLQWNQLRKFGGGVGDNWDHALFSRQRPEEFRDKIQTNLIESSTG